MLVICSLGLAKKRLGYCGKELRTSTVSWSEMFVIQRGLWNG